MSNIAFLGTGLLGSAFVEAALGRGDRVTVWNRTADKARALAPLGATVAASPAAAVRGAERVHLVLRDDAVVEEVLAALRPGLAPDAVVCDHTTTQPALTAERARRLEAEGVRYLHCPVFIGPSAARESKGTILVSGREADWNVVREALHRQATRVEYLGERPDLAATYKLAGNACILGFVGVLADVFALTGAAGVAPQDTLRVLDFFNVPGALAFRGKMIAEQDFAPSFELAMARKDVRLMLETIGDRPMSVLPGLAQQMDAMIAAGHGSEDFAVIGKR